MIRWHHFKTRTAYHGMMRYQDMMICHAMRTRRDMMLCHDMRTAIVSTMTVPEFFLYLCGCVALVRHGRGPRRSVHLSSRRSTLPRKLHMNPAGLTYDPAPHRANHLLSRRFNLPRKLHYVAFISAGAVPNAAPCGPVNLLDRRSNSSRRCAYRVRRLLTMQPPARPIVYSTVARIHRKSCIYILRGVLTMQPHHGRSFTPASIKSAAEVPYTSRAGCIVSH